MQVKLMELPYSTSDLEPYYSQKIIELHYGKHHNAYTNKLNATLSQLPNEVRSIEEILMDLNSLPSNLKTAIANNGGGFYNHNIFWESMSAEHNQKLEEGSLKQAIEKKFGNIDECINKISLTAKNHFGSGWAHLVTNKEGEVFILETHNQETPLEHNLFPLLSIDVWEHAYYPQYLNVRPDYVDAFWSIVNWKGASEKYLSITQ